jgi:hypothetical protein
MARCTFMLVVVTCANGFGLFVAANVDSFLSNSKGLSSVVSGNGHNISVAAGKMHMLCFCMCTCKTALQMFVPS